MAIVIQSGRHHGPEGIGDILERFISSVIVSIEFKKLGFDVELFADWKHSVYDGRANIFFILMDNSEICGIPIKNHLDSDMIHLQGGPIPKSDFTKCSLKYHGIGIYYKNEDPEEILEIFDGTLSKIYKNFSSGVFAPNNRHDIDLRRKIYRSIIFSRKVKKHTRPFVSDVALHVRHGNGEFSSRSQEVLDFITKDIATSSNIQVQDGDIVHIATDSHIVYKIIKNSLNELYNGLRFVTIKHLNREQVGPLHKRGIGVSSAVEDCAEMLQLSRTKKLIYGPSHFNLYANFVNSEMKRVFLPPLRNSGK